MRKFSIVSLIVVLSLSVAAPVFGQGGGGGADGQDRGPSIAEIVVNAAENEDEPQFTLLLQAVRAAGLVDTLAAGGPFTVFAPTDEAFVQLLGELGITPDELLSDTELLTAVLLYHVVPGTLLAEDLGPAQRAGLLTALPQASLNVSLGEGGAFVDRAGIISTDILASNGVIHVIDRVLLPEDGEGLLPLEREAENSIGEFLATLATDSTRPEFTVLVEAARRAGVIEALFAEDERFTLFAPTDAAFSVLLDRLQVTPEELLSNVELLQVVLSYHVLPTAVYAEDFIALDTVFAGTILDGNGVFVTVNANGVFVNRSRVIAPNIIAENGVVHVINSVLLPAPVIEALRMEMGGDMEGEAGGRR